MKKILKVLSKLASRKIVKYAKILTGAYQSLQCPNLSLLLRWWSVKNLPASTGEATDMGSILELGIAPGVGNDNPLEYSSLRNPMHRGA